MDLEHGVARELGQKTLAPRGRLVRRSRPQEERDREPLDDLTLLETIVRTTRMLEGLLGGRGTPTRSAAEVVRLRDQPPGAGESELVMELREGCDRALAGVDQLLRGHLWLGEQA